MHTIREMSSHVTHWVFFVKSMAHGGNAVINNKRKRHEGSINVDNKTFSLAYKRPKNKELEHGDAKFLFRHVLSKAVSVVCANAHETHEMHRKMQPTVSVPVLESNCNVKLATSLKRTYTRFCDPTFLSNVVVWVLVTCCVYTRCLHGPCERSSLTVGWADCIPAILIYFISSVLSPTMNWLMHPANNDGACMLFKPHDFLRVFYAKNVLAADIFIALII